MQLAPLHPVRAHAAQAGVGRCRLTPSPPQVDRAWFQRLALKCDESLSNFAFNFNLRRYTGVPRRVGPAVHALHHSAALPLLRGRAVQVAPIKPTLKAPGTKRLKLNYDKLLSILLQFCFQFQLAPLLRGRHSQRGAEQVRAADGRALHSCTPRLNLSTCLSTDMFQPSFIELNDTLGGVSDRNVSG